MDYLGIQKRNNVLIYMIPTFLVETSSLKGFYFAFLSFSFNKYQESTVKVLPGSKNIHHNNELKNQSNDLMVCLYIHWIHCKMGLKQTELNMVCHIPLPY